MDCRLLEVPEEHELVFVPQEFARLPYRSEAPIDVLLPGSGLLGGAPDGLLSGPPNDKLLCGMSPALSSGATGDNLLMGDDPEGLDFGSIKGLDGGFIDPSCDAAIAFLCDRVSRSCWWPPAIVNSWPPNFDERRSKEDDAPPADKEPSEKVRGTSLKFSSTMPSWSE